MFEPDYQNVVDCALNRVPKRTPLYEHIVSSDKIGEIIGQNITPLLEGDDADKREFFRRYCRFFREHGYDIVPWEVCVTGFMPGSGCLLYTDRPSQITCQADFDRYPFDEVEARFFATAEGQLRALAEVMPAGMKAVGGVGNGVFECVQDIIGYERLCYLRADEPEVYEGMFSRVGGMLAGIWQRFADAYGDAYCVMRFGDDLGFRNTTLLPTEDVRQLILPQYKHLVDIVHRHGKPFLLHSCGCIFDVMEDLITTVGIDAKHSNEDQIAPFPVWVEKYGNRIGNFGGIDTDALCRLPHDELKDYIERVLNACVGHGGFAFGSGNSIPDYVPAEQYLDMIQIVRQWRGDALT